MVDSESGFDCRPRFARQPSIRRTIRQFREQSFRGRSAVSRQRFHRTHVAQIGKFQKTVETSLQTLNEPPSFRRWENFIFGGARSWPFA